MKTDERIDAIGRTDEAPVQSAQESRTDTEAAGQEQAIRDGTSAGVQKKKKKWLVILAALAAVFVLFLIIMPKSRGSTTNPKYVVPINDTQIYFFSLPTRFRKGALCLYDTETGKTRRILDNTIALKTASGIIGFDRVSGSIYRLSGEQAEKIGEIKSDIKWMNDCYAFAENELYFLRQGKVLCKENIQTGQVTELAGRTAEFSYMNHLGLCGGKIFFTDTGIYDGEVRLNVYTLDDAGQETKVCEIKAADGSDFTGAYRVTYFDDFLTVGLFDGLYIIDAEDLSCRKIMNAGPGSVSLYNGKLYFTDDYSLSCIDLATGEKTAVMPLNNVNDGWGLYVTGKGFFYVEMRTGLYYRPFDADQPVHIDN